MIKKNIFIYKNKTDLSKLTYDMFLSELKEHGFSIDTELKDSTDLIACIGGDGTFLHFLHKYDFPSIPILGIKTGHLGFFQDILPENLDTFFKNYKIGNYIIQDISTLKALVTKKNTVNEIIGLNEIVIKGPLTHLTHLDVAIDNTPVQNFSGDGILVATPVGSTAYNYSLNGSLIDPDIDVLQITPMAPMNTKAYSCFHSSIILPANKTVTLTPINRSKVDKMAVVYDGLYDEYSNVEKIEITKSEKTVHLIRFNDYDYLAKLKNKLL